VRVLRFCIGTGVTFVNGCVNGMNRRSKAHRIPKTLACELNNELESILRTL